MAQSPVSVQPNRCSLLGLLGAKHTERDPERLTESRQFTEAVEKRPWNMHEGAAPILKGRERRVQRVREQEEQGAEMQ